MRNLVEICVKAQILMRCFPTFGCFHGEFPRGLVGWTPNLRENRAGVSGATPRDFGASGGAVAAADCGGRLRRGRGGRRSATPSARDDAFSWPQFLLGLPFVIAVGCGLGEIGVRLIYRLSDPSVTVWPL